MILTGQEESDEDNGFDEFYDRLQSIMETLPPKCKEIFILGCVESMSYKEIAQQLDISVNTVKTQVKTAYKKIKDEFGGQEKKFMMFLFLLFR